MNENLLKSLVDRQMVLRKISKADIKAIEQDIYMKLIIEFRTHGIYDFLINYIKLNWNKDDYVVIDYDMINKLFYKIDYGNYESNLRPSLCGTDLSFLETEYHNRFLALDPMKLEMPKNIASFESLSKNAYLDVFQEKLEAEGFCVYYCKFFNNFIITSPAVFKKTIIKVTLINVFNYILGNICVL